MAGIFEDRMPPAVFRIDNSAELDDLHCRRLRYQLPHEQSENANVCAQIRGFSSEACTSDRLPSLFLFSLLHA